MPGWSLARCAGAKLVETSARVGAELALFPESYGSRIFEGFHWSNVLAVVSNVGNAVQRAMRELENAKLVTLYGMFDDAQSANNDRLLMRLSRIRLGVLVDCGWTINLSAAT